MATLTVPSGDQDYSDGSPPATNIDKILFAPTVFSSATFAASQFGGSGISVLVEIDGGNGGNNHIQIELSASSAFPARTTFSALGWKFVNWQAGSDDIAIIGTSADDDITGSSQEELIEGKGGKDTIRAGGGDDTIRMQEEDLVAGETIDGGSHTNFDKLSLNGANGVFNLAASTITNVERLLFLNLQTAILAGTQIGAGGFSEIQGSNGTSTQTLIVNGPSVDLSVLSFFNWDTNDLITINGNALAANTLIGSSKKDTINGGDLADTIVGGLGADVLNGGTGFDTFRYDAAAEAANAESIDGDRGTDRISLVNAGAISFVNVNISSVEQLAFSGGTSTATFVGTQIGNGTGRINAVIGSAATDTLIVNTFNNITSTVDLSTLTFTSWTNGTDSIIIDGAVGSQNLIGSSQNDIINGFGANDTLNGGDGRDIAVFAGSRSAYSVTRSNGTPAVNGPDGNDALSSIEALKFDDGLMSLVARSDFNGDRSSDILFVQPGTNFNSIFEWQFHGHNISGQGGIDLFDKTFTVHVIGDFDGDGLSDLLFQNPTTGGVWEWRLNGTAIISQGAVDVADPTFHLLGAADFDGNGTDDLLFRNDAGFVFMWKMNGRVNTPVPVGPLDPTWHVQGAGDFDGDGKADILLRNVSNTSDNGAFFLWRMDGSNIIGQGGIERPPTEWKTLGLGDFDGDGKTDFAVRNVSATGDNGAVWVYLMNGTTIKAQGAAGIANAAEFAVQSIGDLNGDGKDDILFRNNAGFFYAWDMNGITIGSESLAGTEAGNFADPALHVVTLLWDLV